MFDQEGKNFRVGGQEKKGLPNERKALIKSSFRCFPILGKLVYLFELGFKRASLLFSGNNDKGGY